MNNLRTGATRKALTALLTGPKTNREIQDHISTDFSEVTYIMAKQRAQGNVTRVDGYSGAGYRATYAITESGRRKVG